MIAAKVLVACMLGAALGAAAADYPDVMPGKKLVFPRDYGAHPQYRIEWWYATGQLESARGPLGFQVTFFRLRNREAEDNPSRFAPRQLLFAHAAVSDIGGGRLLHDQRSARAIEGLVEAREADTAVRIDDWSLKREGSHYRATVRAERFTLELELEPTQAVMPQGDRGYSRKGPRPSQASYYYSEPHLRAHGNVTLDGAVSSVQGEAWLDHEWSTEYLAADALGWDWLGANLDDGSALMAFRIRGKDGAVFWASATLRPPRAAARAFTPAEVRFRPRRTWRSPGGGTQYPVAMDIEIDGALWRVDPLMDDQELDARASTGTLYWEGAVRIEGPGGVRGRGYLELTGYAERLRM